MRWHGLDGHRRTLHGAAPCAGTAPLSTSPRVTVRSVLTLCVLVYDPNVLQSLAFPDVNPRLNQLARCSDEPCVNDS